MLCIDRATLVRLVEFPGPPNEPIRDRLIDWAQRASSFEHGGTQATPINQIGVAAYAADDLMLWLDSFDERIQRKLSVTQAEVSERHAQELGMTVEEYQQLDDHERTKRARAHGLRVEIRDECPSQSEAI